MSTLPCPRCGTALTPDSDSCAKCGLTADDLEHDRAPTSHAPRTTRAAPLPPLVFTASGPGAGGPPPRTGRRMHPALVVALTLVCVVVLAFVGLLVVGTVVGTDEEPGAVAAADAEWSPYAEPAGRFQVDLPGSPSHESVDVPLQGGAAALDLYTYATPETEYGVGVMQLPQGFYWESPDEVFAGMIDGFTTDGSTVVSQERVDWAGNPAVEVALQNEGESGRVFALLTGDRVYMVSQGGPAVDDAGFERMRNSLQLTG